MKLKSKQIVSGSEDNSIIIWEESTGECLHSLIGHQRGVNCLVKLNKNQLVSGSESIKVWDFVKGICMKTISLLSDNAGGKYGKT